MQIFEQPLVSQDSVRTGFTFTEALKGLTAKRMEQESRNMDFGFWI
jgi:hypothetical protein